MSRELSAAEIEAIRKRVLEGLPSTHPEEDEEGIITCDACYQQKSLSQFQLHEHWHLCAACAIDYEIARASGEVDTINQYIGTCILPEEWLEDAFF